MVVRVHPLDGKRPADGFIVLLEKREQILSVHADRMPQINHHRGFNQAESQTEYPKAQVGTQPRSSFHDSPITQRRNQCNRQRAVESMISVRITPPAALAALAGRTDHDVERFLSNRSLSNRDGHDGS